MNRIYRLVWSHVSNGWVAVAETTPGRGKGACRKLIAAALTLTAVVAHAAPVGGQVAAGAGNISQSGSTTTIQQSSQNLSLNWKSFNIAPTETVNFVQPSAAAIAVNRIFDTNGTQILGRLNANGQVYLINPNGIVFGRGAQVNVGALVASTLDLSDSSLDRNARAFSGTGSGSIVNQGTINAADGGYVALLGNNVSNQGVITAHLGTVALGAGSAATLTFSGNSLVQMQVDQSVLNSQAANGGLIRADGGMVVMNAGAKDALLASVVNNTGVIEARTVEHRDGTIILLGGMAAGTANVGGRLDASAPAGGNGGFVETSAAKVNVASDAKITTTSSLGRTGTWLIDPQDYTVAASGGDITGTLLSTSLGSTSVVLQSSSGATAGAGNVNVNDAVSWSANTTLTLTASNNVNINADITATGNTAGVVINPNTANGAATASGTGVFNLNHASVTLSGTNPSLSIAGAAYTVINSLGAAGSTTGTDLQGINGNVSGYYALGSNIDASATSAWNAGAGFAPLGKPSAFTGRFDGLGHTISNLVINTSGTSEIGLFGATSNAGLQNVGLVGGTITGRTYVGALVGNKAGGTVTNAYASTTVNGFSWVGGLIGLSNGGTITKAYATGAVSGTSNLIGGLVGQARFYGAITDSYATGSVSAAGAYYVGGLVGQARFVTVTNSYATGPVTGEWGVGGLVGYLDQTTINKSYASGAVTNNDWNAGGLVGSNGGTITNSYWNTQSSGAADSAGGLGMNTAQMQTQANFTSATAANGNVNPAWDFAATWVMYEGQTAPLLRSLMTPLTVTASNATRTYDGNAYSGGNGVTYSTTPNGNLLGTLSYSGTSQGAVNANSYAITPGGLHSNQQGYIISYADGALAVTPKALTATVTAPNKVYDGDATVTPTLSITAGLVGLETVAATGTASFNTKDVATANLVTVSSTTLGNGSNGGLATNYSLASGQTVAANITPKALTAAVAAPNKVYDGDATATPTLSITAGLVGAETVTAAGTASFNTKDVATANLVTVSSTTLANGSNGGLATNYSLASGQTVAANITPKALTASVAATNKVYDGDATATPTMSITAGLVGTETVTAAGTASFNTKDVATANLVTVSSTTLGNGSNGGLATNYSLASGQSVAASITPKALTATVTAPSKVYDGDATATPTLSITAGLVGTETVAAAGTATFNTKDVATANLVTVSSTTLGNGSNGGIATNYSLASGQSVAASITPKALTASVAALNKVYDGDATATPTLSITAGLIGTETVAATGTASFNTKDVATANLVTVSSTALGNGSNGGLATNYSLTSGQTVAANITPRALTATVAAPNKVYDGDATATPTLSITAGLVGTETVTAAGIASFNTKDVATANLVTVSSTTLGNGSNGGLATNYSLTSGQTVAANVTPKALTATVAAPSKVYDGDATATPTMSITAGLVGTETVTAAGIASFNTKDVATANLITVNSTTLGDGSNGGLATNYSLASGQTVAANITPKALTASVAALNKVYDGDATATPTLSITAGLVGTETVAAAGTATFNTKDVATANLVTVNSTTLANGNNGGIATNYSLTSGQTVAAAITPKALTATVAAPSKFYDGDATATPTLSINAGLVGTETVTVTGTASFNTKDVATANLVTVSSTALGNGNNGGIASNYSLTSGQTVAANITPKTLTAAVTASNKVYDGDATATPTLSITAGLVGIETIAATGTASFNTKDVATANLVTVSSTTLGNGSNGGLATNYSLASGQTVAANITPKALTAIVAAPNKVYDGDAIATPTMSIIAGLVGTETVAATGTASFNTKDVATANLVTVSSTALGNGSNGGLATNYSLASGQTVAANITPKALTATVVAPNKVYDGDSTATPTLSITAGLVGTETVSAASTATFNTKDVATANLVTVSSTTLGNGSNGGLATNYSLASGQSVAANITPKALTATVAAPNKVYDGDATATPTLSITAGLVGTETVAATGTATFNTKDVATANLVTVSSTTLANGNNGGIATNYSLASGQSVAANITPKALTATVAAPSKVYDGDATATPTLSINAGLVGTETVTVTGTASFNTKDVATANLVTVSSTSLANGNNGGLATNYSLASGQTVAASITPKALTATVVAPNKVYDGNSTATPTLSITAGLIGTETVATTGTASFNTKDVATANLVTVSSTALGNGSNGGLATNYSLASGQTVAAHITPKALFVSGTTADNKVYDGGTRATLNTAAVDFNGLVAGDAVRLSATGAFADSNVGTAKNVTLANEFTGADVGNYRISAQSSTTADITAITLDLVPGTPLERALNTPTQFQSDLMSFPTGSQPQTRSLSPATTVTQISGDDTAGGDDGLPRSGNGNRVNATMSIGGSGSTLQIINGGVRLPANTVDAQQ